ncbi:MAG TPA: dihydrofolate reductase family protein [Amnibacterium sp.]|jgi:riboflavin biosynthesis pyrimidine reductase|uniref:dihydrofolate reductase family protein n=1 Tax=Amnibacterium sp. TaxID=1872496 RepID=UPI002F91E298
MRVTGLVPATGALDLDGDDLDAWLTERYALPGHAWLRLNLITALGGQITGPSGRSDDLADGIDRPLLKVLRSGADVVLVGAASVRAEGYTIPRRAPLAVATTTGDLAGHRFPADLEPGRLLVVGPESARARVEEELGDRAHLLPAPEGGDPRGVIDALRAAGYGRIVCEGGGHLASGLVAAGVVDEFDHSIAPVLVSPGAPLSTGDLPLTHAHLAGLVLDETDRLYARWALPRR